MTEALIQHIAAFAIHAQVWGFLLIVVFMAVESSFIPFPSEVVMIPAGFLAARAGLTFGNPALDAAVAVVAGTFGSLVGAWVNYLLARRLGAPFLERYGRYFLLPPAKLHRAEELFRQYGAGATFFCRLLPAIRQLISIPAGLSGMNIRTFTLWTGLGAGLWVSVLVGIGYSIGAHTADMGWAELVHSGKDLIHQNLVWIVPACLVGIGLYVWISGRIMRQGKASA